MSAKYSWLSEGESYCLWCWLWFFFFVCVCQKYWIFLFVFMFIKSGSLVSIVPCVA